MSIFVPVRLAPIFISRKPREIFLERLEVFVVAIFFDDGDDLSLRNKTREIVDVSVGIVAGDSVAEPKNLSDAQKIAKSLFDLFAA